jgi:hypothetical protein
MHKNISCCLESQHLVAQLQLHSAVCMHGALLPVGARMEFAVCGVITAPDRPGLTAVAVVWFLQSTSCQRAYHRGVGRRFRRRRP